MARFRKNAPVAAKRRVKVYIWLDDGSGPAPAASTFAAVAASVALTGTHHATLTWLVAGLAGNVKTITLAADGAGVGSLTNAGNAYTFHYATGVTTMANFVTAAAAVFAFSGHTPADVLVSPGDTQGPLALVGGIAYGWEVSQSTPTFAAAAGTVTNCTRADGTGIDGLFQYEFTQAELNFLGSEVTLRLEYPGFRADVATCEMNDAADFDSIAEGSSTYGDFQRLATWVLAGKVQDFGSGVLAFRNLSDTKTVLTSFTSSLGRIAIAVGDLT